MLLLQSKTDEGQGLSIQLIIIQCKTKDGTGSTRATPESRERSISWWQQLVARLRNENNMNIQKIAWPNPWGKGRLEKRKADILQNHASTTSRFLRWFILFGNVMKCLQIDFLNEVVSALQHPVIRSAILQARAGPGSDGSQLARASAQRQRPSTSLAKHAHRSHRGVNDCECTLHSPSPKTSENSKSQTLDRQFLTA